VSDADDELERELRRRVRAGARGTTARGDATDDAPLPDEPYDWPGPTLDHPTPRRAPRRRGGPHPAPRSSSPPRGRRVPPRPAQQGPRRRGRGSSLSLPSLPSGVGDITGGAGGLGWALATAVIGLSLVYLLVNERGKGPKGFSALVNGVSTAVSLLVEPVDPLGGTAALARRVDPNQAVQASAARGKASKPVGAHQLGQRNERP
jgi:hypothetical protein